ncbi:sugar phosphate isomerase/epimerase [Mangrovimonas sp. ST2L15]|uniref:sugar phosphate isomerase/epimerase family protein n=1 Tax=Mangrovimonas sp. ST2L15 TaxID=1645916 RepID=UPI0006B57051|nr:sugar phosphate isomerase/epimerase family protein [Mangrovimonas sp. ST2L15]
MNNRRKFFKQSVLASAALAVGNFAGFALENSLNSEEKITENKSIKQMTLATISWTFGLDDLDELFTKVKEIGYTGLQFCGDFKKYKAEEVVAKSKEYGIALTSYDPLSCKPDTDEDATLEKSVAFYKQVIDYALALGVPMSTLQGLSFWTKNQPNYEASMEQIAQAVKQLSDYAKGKNILLSYEACCHYEVPQAQTADELLRIYKDAGSPSNVKLVLDSFHMNITEKDMISPIKAIGGDLLYSYHVSDSGRGGIGTGHIDYLAQFNTLKEVGFNDLLCFEIVIAECRPYKLPMNKEQMEEFVKQSKYSLNIWKTMMNT